MYKITTRPHLTFFHSETLRKWNSAPLSLSLSKQVSNLIMHYYIKGAHNNLATGVGKDLKDQSGVTGLEKTQTLI